MLVPMKADPGREADDEALVRAHLADPEGDSAAVLIDRWQDRVYQWAYRVVRDHDVALDVAQDALVAMYEALPNYRPYGRFGAWLFTIVHNRARSEVRKRPLVRDPGVELDDLVAGLAGPDDALVQAEHRGRVLAAMRDALDPDERAAVWLRAYEGLGMDDITQMLGLRNATGARGVLQSARRKLRRELGVEPDPEGGT